MNSTLKTLRLGATLLGLAVAIGAFGAHGLEGKLSDALLKTYHTGVTYHFYHGMAVILCGILKLTLPQLKSAPIVNCFLVGILFFCTNCYLYSLTNIKFFALLVPIGGISFIVGWFWLAISLSRITLNKSL